MEHHLIGLPFYILKLTSMKSNFTLLLIFAACFSSFNSSGQSVGDYRSIATGNWATLATWQRFDGAIWVAAPSAPTSADGVITIRSPHTVTIAAAVTADQIVVDAGGRLNNNTGGQNLTLNNGTGDDLTVNGIYLLRSFNTLGGTGNVVVNGTFEWFSGTIAVPVTTNSGSTTTISLDFPLTLNNTLINGGTVNWAAGPSNGNITFNSGTFTNNGTINTTFTGSTKGFVTGTGTNTFTNNGTFNNLTTIGFANNSVIFNNGATGVLGGIGSYSITGTVTNTGTIRPGNSPGILTVNPAILAGQNASVDIEANTNAGPGTGHDQLSVTGNLNLNTLTLNVSAPALLSLGSYTILTTTGTFSNNFATVNFPSPITSGTYTLSYTANSVVLNKIGFALPATWGDFSAIANKDVVNLKWTTLSENNTSHFVVEYSDNGRSFIQLATIKAQGDAATESTYTFEHNRADKFKTNFYRIRLVDKDDKFGYSAIRSAKFDKGRLILLQASPNPVINTLLLQVQENNLLVRIIDYSGREVKTLNLQKGAHQVDMSRMAAGQYHIIVSHKGEIIQQQSIIKQ
jgi:hypothetical protein